MTMSPCGTDTNMPNGHHDARDMDVTEALVTVAEAAVMLGLSERTVRRKIAANELPSVKSGRARLIPISAVTVSPLDDVSDRLVMASRHDMSDIESATVLTLVDRIGGLERLVGRLEQERDDLAARLAVSEERLRVLPAGQGTPSAAPTLHREAQLRSTPLSRDWRWWPFNGLPWRRRKL